MSLINEALKKARDQNTSAPMMPTGVAVRGPTNKSSLKMPIILGVVTGTVVVVLAGGLWWLLAQKPPVPQHRLIVANNPTSATSPTAPRVGENPPPTSPVAPAQPREPQVVVPPPQSPLVNLPALTVVTSPPPQNPEPVITAQTPPQHFEPSGRNPFQPTVAEPPPVAQPPPVSKKIVWPSLKVNGTSVFGNNRVAFINNQRVYEGDEIEGATVVEIKLDGVWMQLEGVKKFIRSD